MDGLLVNIPGLLTFRERRAAHVVILLLGQVKGEDHARRHLMHCVNVTGSRIPVRVWLTRLKKKVNESMGSRTIGPAFVNPVPQAIHNGGDERSHHADDVGYS